jgi:hypothetical protein
MTASTTQVYLSPVPDERVDHSDLLAHFDYEFYASVYPEAARECGDLLEHYLSTGWREGKNPSASFCSTFYILSNPDVADLDINPLTHYLAHGRQEGRAAFPGVLSVSVEAVREIFDPEFYLRTQSDIAATRLDPLAHFLRFGWCEGRLPSAALDFEAHLGRCAKFPPGLVHPFLHLAAQAAAVDERPFQGPFELLPDVRELIARHFDARFYLERHADVEASGMNPLEHYLHAGHAEGRSPNPWFDPLYYVARYADVGTSGLSPFVHYVLFGRRAGRATSSLLLWQKRAIMDAARPQPSSLHMHPHVATSRIARALTASLSGRRGLAIALSHDVYVENIGGVQVFIQDEARQFSVLDHAYLHLAPGRSALRVLSGEDPEEFSVVVTIDGLVLGQIAIADLLRTLLDCLSAAPGILLTFVVHSLLGHDPAVVADLYCALPSNTKAYYWLHDFSAVCPSFNLLRNGIKFCHAPSVDSDACSICHFGQARRDARAAIDAFFDRVPVLIVAPSESARRVWADAGLASRRSVTTVPHGELRMLPGQVTSKAPRLPLRVAFCGYPTHHKGWHVFQNLLDVYGASPLYEFHHFAALESGDARVIFHLVEVNAQNRIEMTRALRERSIDVVCVPPIWPETFCFIAYEALAAGAILVTLAGSGNVEDLARTHGERAIVVDDRESLLYLFGSEKLVEHVRRFQSGYCLAEFGLTGTTAKLLDGGASRGEHA